MEIFLKNGDFCVVVRVQQVHLALCAEMVAMVKNDLNYVLPDDSGVRACSLAIAQLSHTAVNVVSTMETKQ